MTKLSAAAAAELIAAAAAQVVEAESDLAAADREIGDGDHGRGMARGFTAATKALSATSLHTVADVFRTAGDALLETMGGASGVVFGTMLRGDGGSHLRAPEVDSDALAAHFEDALAKIQERGHAGVGDKTMVDALDPAVRALKRAADRGLPVPDALAAAAEAATAGCESTRPLTARFGKASTLGDRAIGHVDPGALSVALIFAAMASAAGIAAHTHSPAPLTRS